MEYKNLLIEVADGVATLTVNSPRTLNALNSEILEELERALGRLDGDAGIKVVVLTGAGEKAFVAGADIKEMAGMDCPQAHRFSLKGQRVLLAMAGMRKPVIAAVNGLALGGGLELALACDFIYASAQARLGFPEVSLGIMPGFGGTQALSRLIGAGRAKELIFTGKMITAEKAQAWGIVNELCPAEELLPRVKETAAAIASVGPLAVAAAKDAIGNGLDMTRENGFRYEASLFGLLFDSEDQKEGMSAFVEKRKAEFKGR